MDTQAPNEEGKPVPCPECGSRFSRQQDLQRHITMMRKKPSRRCTGGASTSNKAPPSPAAGNAPRAPTSASVRQTPSISSNSSSERSLGTLPPTSIAHASGQMSDHAMPTVESDSAQTAASSSSRSMVAASDEQDKQKRWDAHPPREPVHPGTFVPGCFEATSRPQAAPRRIHGPPTYAEAVGVGLHNSPLLAQLKSLGVVPDALLKHPGLTKNPFLPHNGVTAFRIAYLEIVQLHLTHSESSQLHDCFDDILQALDKTLSVPRLPTMKKQILEHSPFVLKAKTTAITEGIRSFIFKFRPFIPTMKALLGRSHLAKHYHVTPKYHVVAGDREGVCSNACRQYSSIPTGLRWERLAAQLPDGHASVPYFIGSDKAVVFGQTVAWPIVLHLAAYDKCIHNRPLIHTSFVLGYLVQPTKVHQDIESLSAARSASISKSVFHKCLAVLLDDEVRTAAADGVKMRFPDGNEYMAHPQLLDYLGDLPEKALAALVKQNVACVQCCAPAGSFHKRYKDTKQRSEEMVRHALDILEEKGATKTLQEDWEKEHGVFLMPNALWELPHFDVHKFGLCDDLHQLYIGVFGRHLCGTLFEYLEQQPAVEQEFRLRLAGVPGFPTQQFHSLSSVTYAASQVTAATWKSLVHVMPALVHDLFDADDMSEYAVRLRTVVPETFSSFARLSSKLDQRCFTDAQVDEVEYALDDFFDNIPRYYAAFRKPPPSGALTLHTLNHSDRSLRECGGLDEYSTGTRIELLHKFLVKLPGEFVNPRDVLEIGLFDYIQVHDAMTEHLAWLALYRPELIADWSWGPSAEPIFELIDGVRDLGIPGVPMFGKLAKSSKQSARDALAVTSEDEHEWTSSAAGIPEHPAALKFEERFSLYSRAAASVLTANVGSSMPTTGSPLLAESTANAQPPDPHAPAFNTRPPDPHTSVVVLSATTTLADSTVNTGPPDPHLSHPFTTPPHDTPRSQAAVDASGSASPLLAQIEHSTAIANRNYTSLLKLVNHDGGSRQWYLSTPLRQLRHWKDRGGTTLDKVIQTLGQETFGGMHDAIGHFALQFLWYVIELVNALSLPHETQLTTE
ncbi:hypothetical protein BCR44DRAFT_384516 [Catenaria anguillulae PL171]|uniref:C2H2-type domain-containing protein n=1 Tax=Catenaria anguillulae PL171 TaxID=765915 RepID=A0A1Y2HZ14_9FUNG|nr:hypothetical protein BCR44DRAFT_384516 [Catenaria anguillulae PL171]